MTVFIIRRMLQSTLIVFAMTVLVFFGVNVIGNPVDILINPDCDQQCFRDGHRRAPLPPQTRWPPRLRVSAVNISVSSPSLFVKLVRYSLQQARNDVVGRDAFRLGFEAADQPVTHRG